MDEIVSRRLRPQHSYFHARYDAKWTTHLSGHKIQENICVFPGYENPSVGLTVHHSYILSEHREMTVEQADRYIPVAIRPNLPSYGSCCHTSTVNKKFQARYQVIPCRIFGGQSGTDTKSPSNTVFCLLNITWQMSHLHSYIQNIYFDSKHSCWRLLRKLN